MRRTGAGTLRREHVGSRVKLQAWVDRRRDHGGLIFFDLRDRSGVVQVVVRPTERPEAARQLDPVRSEWVIEVTGEVTARSRETVNAQLPTGEVEVVAESASVLSRAEPLPFGIESQAEVGEETRLRYRYLELRRPELRRNFELRHRVALETRRYFGEHGFLEVETPILTRSTPEGARDYLVPSRIHRGRFYALPQSPQLFKQLLMVAGFERYFQIARCFRDEDLRADRQPEFTQIDLELSFTDEEEVFGLVEGLFERLFPSAGIPVDRPFPRLTQAEALARYGTDRPDLRFDLEIQDLSESLAQSGFRGFQKAVAEGGVVRGFAVPGAAGASRSQAEAWAARARQAGAAGILTLKRQQGELLFQVQGALSPAELEATAERLGLEEGGLALLVAGPAAVTTAALGALRLELARTYELIPRERHAFVWVTHFPLVEWSEEASRWVSNHHPFTAPDPGDLERLEEAPATVRSRAYDVVLDGVELGGGSIRIHEPELQERVFRLLGIGAEEARARFGFLLDAFRYGAPPHGGIALGLDRMVMLMAGAASIREVIAFPKTTSALCLMTQAPSGVDPGQLRELGLRATSPPAPPEEPTT